MAFPRPEPNVSIVRKRATEELVRGREWAYQLQLAMLRGSSTSTTPCLPPTNSVTATNIRSSSPDHAHRDHLVAKILESFTLALSILLNSGGEADEVSQVPATAAGMNSPCSDSRKPSSQQDSSELSCKPSAAPKDRRGCYKRRRTSETWTTESPTLVDDGHAWRKYGQKAILNAEYPRNYFRCTHKYDQGCKATKQVQKIQDDPLVFRTTYQARHTCKNLLLLQQEQEEQAIATATTRATSATPRESSILLSFESSSSQVPPNVMFMMMTKQSSLAKAAAGSGSGGGDDGLLPLPGPVPVPVPALKQEEMNKEEVIHTDPSTSTSTSTLFRNQPSSSSSSSDHDHFLPQEDFTTFETSDPLTLAAMSSEGSEHGDFIPSGVYSSCTTATSTQSLEMDHMVMAVNDFDDFSQFDFDT